MKKRTTRKKKESGFDGLARLIKSESEDIRSGIQEFREEVQEFREEANKNFKELREEIRDIKQRLEVLEQKVSNISGYSKEIDHLLTRVSRIEKRLGIASK